MTNEDLRHHSHTKPGDGGKIDGVEMVGDTPTVTTGFTTVQSGDTTVAANGSQTISINQSRETYLLLAAYPDSSYSGTLGVNNIGGDTAVVIEYNSGWQINIDEVSGEEITVNWEVYQL